MPWSSDDLENLLKEFGVSNEVEMFKKRTTNKVVKASVFVESPKLVEMTEDQCKKLCDKSGLRFHTGLEKRIIERVTTTEAPDRYGDIVRYKGIDNSNYRKNAVVMFAHEHGDFPVGKSIKEWQDHSIKGWRSLDLYFDDDIDPTGKSDLVFRMVFNGAMPAGSIGFMPKTANYDLTPKQKEEMGLGRFGVEYLTCEKLEHSACSIPANPECLSNFLKSVEEKKLRAAFGKDEIDRISATKLLDENMLDVFASILGVKRTIIIPPVKTVAATLETSVDVITPKLEEILTSLKGLSSPVQPSIIVNNDFTKLTEQLTEVNLQVKTLCGKLEEIQKSHEERFTSLQSTTNRALSALEARTNKASLYDKKEIAGILKV